MRILAIETSCDETAVTVLECSGTIESPVFRVLGNTLLSQAMKHAEFGGVYPNLAKRLHQKNLIPVLKETLNEAGYLNYELGMTSYDKDDVEKILEREPELLKEFLEYVPAIEIPKIDAVAVTQGPGLEPALWVGVNFAKALAFLWNLPLIPVNHMEGHIASVLVHRCENPKPEIINHKNVELPAVALLISGGHTELVLVKAWGEYELIGQTRDDAVGEAFDKTARILGLPYPGGPHLSVLAESARNPASIPHHSASPRLPRPMLKSGDCDFSFAGLKTAALYLVRELGEIDDIVKAEIAREFEDSVTDVLMSKTTRAMNAYQAPSLIIGGGVIANTHIRRAFENLAREAGWMLYIPSLELTTDNAVMIGAAAYLKHLRGYEDKGTERLHAKGNLRLHHE